MILKSLKKVTEKFDHLHHPQNSVSTAHSMQSLQVHLQGSPRHFPNSLQLQSLLQMQQQIVHKSRTMMSTKTAIPMPT